MVSPTLTDSGRKEEMESQKSRRDEVDLSHPSQRDRCLQILYFGEKSIWED
jgi:hypothetical protein